MKRYVYTFLALMILTAGSALAAGGYIPRMSVNIEFPFYINNQLLPAGQYWFEMRATGSGSSTGSSILLRNENGHVSHVMPRWATLSAKDEDQVYLVFDRIGTKYFLTRVHQGWLEAGMGKSRTQKELEFAAVRGTKTETTTVAAAPQRVRQNPKTR